jgi:TRAP-type uncharacterized transport system substrate-binding protein
VWSYLTVGQSIDRTQLSAFLDKLYANKDAYAKKYHPKWSQLDKAASIAVLKQIPSNGWARESVYYLADTPRNMTEPQPYFCSASPQGTYTKVVKDLIPVIKSVLGISLTEKHTVGSLVNLLKLHTRKCAMALIQYDMNFSLVSQGKNKPNLSEEMLMATVSDDIIMALYLEDGHMIVNTGSGIESGSDLVGKKINLGERLSGSYASANTALYVNGIKLEEITPFYDLPPVALPKVISGEYDAMALVSKAPVSFLVEADCPTDAKVSNCVAGDPSTLPIKLVPVQIPFSALKTTLSAKHYPWQQVDIQNSPQLMALLVMSPTLSIDDSRMADLINAVYAIPVADSTHSPTWNETTVEQGMAYFKLNHSQPFTVGLPLSISRKK